MGDPRSRVTTRSDGTTGTHRVGSILPSDCAVASSLWITLSEWQCMTWSWYCDAAMATFACPCKRQFGAHTTQGWATRKSASVAAATSRLSGREVVSLWDGLLCIIDVESSTEC